MDTVEIAGSGLRTNVNDRNGVAKGMECKRTLDSTYFTLSYFLLFLYLYGSSLCYAKIYEESQPSK